MILDEVVVAQNDLPGEHAEKITGPKQHGVEDQPHPLVVLDVHGLARAFEQRLAFQGHVPQGDPLEQRAVVLVGDSVVDHGEMHVIVARRLLALGRDGPLPIDKPDWHTSGTSKTGISLPGLMPCS